MFESSSCFTGTCTDPSGIEALGRVVQDATFWEFEFRVRSLESWKGHNLFVDLAAVVTID